MSFVPAILARILGHGAVRVHMNFIALLNVEHLVVTNGTLVLGQAGERDAVLAEHVGAVVVEVAVHFAAVRARVGGLGGAGGRRVVAVVPAQVTRKKERKPNE